MGQITYEQLTDALAEKIQEGIDITDIATDSKLGIVKVDNTSITVDADGTLHAVGGSGGGGLTSADIADNLTTDDSTKVLSAKQGKILNDKVVDVEGDVATIINSIIEIENGTSLTGVVKTVNNIAPDGNGNVEITVSGDGLTTADILDVLDSTATDKALSANQGKTLDDKITTHAETKASTTVLGHVTVDGTTIQSVDGELQVINPFTTENKTKLDGIEEDANNYTLPMATDTILGGVKVDDTSIVIDSNGVIRTALQPSPLIGNFTTTVVNTPYKHYKPSINVLPTDHLHVVYNGLHLREGVDWILEEIDEGAGHTIKLNIDQSQTDDLTNIMHGTIHRGFGKLV